MRVVVAVGGNALLERADRPDADIQVTHLRRAARALAPIAAEHELIVCHGNGPQVGLLAVESESDRLLSRPYPLDALVAQTQGMIGYWFARELRNAGVTRPVVAMVTRTLVDPDDPAFAAPSKFIGRVYTRERAHQLARAHGWSVGQDGAGWRRRVPSPSPAGIVELVSILDLLTAGAVVICGGGGGVPVTVGRDGATAGVEAVVDKDLTAAMIGIDVDADRLVVLTDVPAVMSDWGTPRQAPIARIEVDAQAREAADTGLDARGVAGPVPADGSPAFPAGSMGPKVAACRMFTATTGRASVIGALDDAAAVLAGTAGTTVDLTRETSGAPAAATARSRPPGR